jgi:spore germination protein YaaH
VLAFATSQMPVDKVLLGLAFYGYDWNTTTGRTRALSYRQAARLAEHYQAPITIDPASQSATFSYQETIGQPLPASLPPLPPLEHEITRREAPPCPGSVPAPPPAPSPRASAPPGTVESHVVWLEESVSALARLGLASRYQAGGVATWRLGLEDSRVWPMLQEWRAGRY